MKISFVAKTSKSRWLTLLTYLASIAVVITVYGRSGLVSATPQQDKKLATKKANLKKELHILRIGIQGGKGSFNELALKTFFESSPEQPYKILYLHTTENVLRALEKGEIDRGQFAIKNTLGGEVTESVESMKKHKFKTVCQYDLKVAHTLMMSPNASLEELDTVVAHPQALKQCKEHLKKYPKLKQFSGEGDLVDPSTWAENLSKGKIGLNYAILGNKKLAELNKLKVVRENMQDRDDNYTTFVLVKARD